MGSTKVRSSFFVIYYEGFVWRTNLLLVIISLLVTVALPAMLRRNGLHSAAGGSAGYVMFYYTYVLKSLKDDNLYIGFATNLDNRLEEHKKGLVAATKYRRPLELVYFEGCLDKANAVKREKQLKTGFGRAYLKKRI